VGEVPLGTPLRDIIRQLGDGPEYGHTISAVLPGAAHPLIPEPLLDTPAAYEDLAAVGSGLGAGGFIVFDDTDDPVAIAHGVARFLAVESCGQCRPCKLDGLDIADRLGRLEQGRGTELDVTEIASRVRDVTVGARCYLAHQQQRIIESVLAFYPDELRARAGASDAVDPVLIAPIVNLEGGQAQLAEGHAGKQPDWTYGATWSGKSPADGMARVP
jgi:NADH:ubiquinone oxidoreductase subunit F (NADH-binding)